jgi:hypothetical protein
MTKENKKKVFIIVGIILAFILLIYMLKKNKPRALTNANNSNANPDTYYLTNNIPPINASGFTMPNFGPVTIATGGMSGGSGGSCNGCDVISNFGNTQQLSQYLNGMGNYTAALQDALNAASPDYSYQTNNVFESSTSPLSDNRVISVGYNEGETVRPYSPAPGYSNLPVVAI